MWFSGPVENMPWLVLIPTTHAHMTAVHDKMMETSGNCCFFSRTGLRWRVRGLILPDDLTARSTQLPNRTVVPCTSCFVWELVVVVPTVRVSASRRVPRFDKLPISIRITQGEGSWIGVVTYTIIDRPYLVAGSFLNCRQSPCDSPCRSYIYS